MSSYQKLDTKFELYKRLLSENKSVFRHSFSDWPAAVAGQFGFGIVVVVGVFSVTVEKIQQTLCEWLHNQVI